MPQSYVSQLSVGFPLALTFLVLVSLLLGAPNSARAQGGVDDSGMGQGEAEISERTDVRMGIRNGAGTSGARLEAMTDAVGSTLGGVRTCYAERVEDMPTVTGTMRVMVTAERGRRARIQVASDSAEDEVLSRCVLRLLRRANYPRVDRAARVTVTLEFTNTSAEGVERMRARTGEEVAAVAVQRGEGGRLTAVGGTPGNEVRFRISTVRQSDEASVRATHSAIRSRVAGLLDCRRRAGRRGMDPSGTLSYRVAIPARGRRQVTQQSSTVEHDRAGACVSRVLSRMACPSEAAGIYDVSVDFRGQQALDVAPR